MQHCKILLAIFDIDLAQTAEDKLRMVIDNKLSQYYSEHQQEALKHLIPKN